MKTAWNSFLNPFFCSLLLPGTVVMWLKMAECCVAHRSIHKFVFIKAVCAVFVTVCVDSSH